MKRRVPNSCISAEQLANKLDVIGRRGRSRNHLDAFRICGNQKIDWKKARNLFNGAACGKAPARVHTGMPQAAGRGRQGRGQAQEP